MKTMSEMIEKAKEAGACDKALEWLALQTDPQQAWDTCTRADWLEWYFQKFADATALAEYEKVRDTAFAEYLKVRDTALAEYQKVRDTAWAKYQKATAPAWDEYQKVRDTALAEYQKVQIENIRRLMPIP